MQGIETTLDAGSTRQSWSVVDTVADGVAAHCKGHAANHNTAAAFKRPYSVKPCVLWEPVDYVNNAVQQTNKIPTLLSIKFLLALTHHCKIYTNKVG